MSGNDGQPDWLVSEALSLDRRRAPAVALAEHSSHGILCPDQLLEVAQTSLWTRWREISFEDSAPTVLPLDFSGITSLRRVWTFDCLVYFLGGVGSGSRPCYPILENVAPTEAVLYTLEYVLQQTHVVVIARTAGGEYGLLGDSDKVRKYRDAWSDLRNEGHWVKGGPFQAHLRLSRGIFESLHKERLAVRDVDGNPWYLSIV